MDTTDSQRIPSVSDEEPGLPTAGVQRIQIQELTFEKLIGEGNYGDVHKGKYFEVDCAIKQIILDDKEYFKYIKREIRILSQMRHPFILQFLGVCEHGPDIFIVTEYLSSGDVTQLLEGQSDVPWTLRLSIATQLCQALIYLHSKDIIHRDLKPDNILLDEHNNIRLADFGLARSLDTSTRERALTICGTDGFIAPEVMLGMNYSKQCDVFSYGMVLAQLITRLEPGEDFWQRGETDELGLDDDEFNALVPTACPTEFRDLTLGCGAFDPDDRPIFADILGVLKYVNTKLAGGSVRRAARRGRRTANAADDKTATLLGTLSRKTLRDTGADTLSRQTVKSDSNDNDDNAAPAPNQDLSTNTDKSTQMLLFHVMKLLQRSTNEDYSDAPYAEDFLLTYVEFLPQIELLKLVRIRFEHSETKPPADATDIELQELKKRAQLIRMRSLAFVKLWIRLYLQDFDEPGMDEELKKFDEQVAKAGFNKTVESQMSSVVARKRQHRNDAPIQPTFATPAPAPFNANPPLGLLRIQPLEIARQFTLLHMKVFVKIEMRDLLHDSWKLKPTCAANQFVTIIDKLRVWTVSAILREDSNKIDNALSHLITVAGAFLEIQNFAAAFTMSAALSHPAVKRLRAVFSRLPPSATSILNRLKALEANDYQQFRALTPTPPAVPHFSAALDEISYVEASSAPRLPSGIINFRRFRHIGNVCRQLRLYQQSHYNLTPLTVIQTFLENELTHTLDDEAAKKRSFQIEAPV